MFKKRRSNWETVFRLAGGFLGVVALLFVTSFAMRGAWNMYTKMTQASEARQSSQIELTALETQQAQVSASLEELSSARGVETEVRQRFGVARPGEGRIEIVEDSVTSATVSEPKSGWFGRLVHALFAW